MELITRSGTNQFHGNLFEYLRNTELNANNFFNNATRVKRPKYIQNLFGGSVGGPVKKGKTFFFFNYQGSRISQELTRTRTVLTLRPSKASSAGAPPAPPPSPLSTSGRTILSTRASIPRWPRSLRSSPTRTPPASATD